MSKSRGDIHITSALAWAEKAEEHLRRAAEASRCCRERMATVDPVRVRSALRLQELVERTLQNDGEVSFDHPITGRYQVHIGVRDEPASGATLDEAVEAALKELGDG